MTRSWTIGSRPDCDLVVDSQKVSGQHCRLSRDGDGFVLDDLGSTNGTYVNGNRVAGSVRVRRNDQVTLGLTTPMPWPPGLDEPSSAAARPFHLRGPEAVIGRAAGCDFVVDLPMVSSRHARLFLVEGQLWIEDLGSANGTYVNGRRIEGLAALEPGDPVHLGSHPLAFTVEPAPASTRVPTPPADDGRSPDVTPVPSATPYPAVETGGAWTPAGPSAAPGFPWRLVAWLGQAPVLAAMIVLALRPSGTRGVAAVLFGLGLAATWFGLSGASFGGLIDADRLRDGAAPGGLARVVPRLLALAGFVVAQCVVAWLIVAAGAGLKGPAAPSVALLAVTGLAGLALGVLIVAASPRAGLVATLAPVALAVVALFGGGPWPVGRMPAPAKVVASLAPPRWAYEGLLLLDSGPDRPAAEGDDPVEAAFPAATERMGVRADLAALALTAVGLAATAGFIARERWRVPPPPEG